MAMCGFCGAVIDTLHPFYYWDPHPVKYFEITEGGDADLYRRVTVRRVEFCSSECAQWYESYGYSPWDD